MSSIFIKTAEEIWVEAETMIDKGMNPSQEKWVKLSWLLGIKKQLGPYGERMLEIILERKDVFLEGKE